DEYLEVCRRLWRDDVAAFEGSEYRLPPVRTGPKPVQRPWPPLWVGGNSRPALERAVKLGDGWHLIDLDPAEVEASVAQLDARLVARGGARAGFGVSLRKGVRARVGERARARGRRRERPEGHPGAARRPTGRQGALRHPRQDPPRPRRV